jgi:membrane protein DedA with SNARE-associated domain
MLALIKLPTHLGYLILFGLVGAESTGVPVPGETALITAAGCSLTTASFTSN